MTVQGLPEFIVQLLLQGDRALIVDHLRAILKDFNVGGYYMDLTYFLVKAMKGAPESQLGCGSGVLDALYCRQSSVAEDSMEEDDAVAVWEEVASRVCGPVGALLEAMDVVGVSKDVPLHLCLDGRAPESKTANIGVSRGVAARCNPWCDRASVVMTKVTVQVCLTVCFIADTHMRL